MTLTDTSPEKAKMSSKRTAAYVLMGLQTEVPVSPSPRKVKILTINHTKSMVGIWNTKGSHSLFVEIQMVQPFGKTSPSYL